MLKTGIYNPNLNDLIRIVKYVSIDINVKTNKHLVGNMDDLNDFIEILQKNENFNILSSDDLSELKLKFKPFL